MTNHATSVETTGPGHATALVPQRVTARTGFRGSIGKASQIGHCCSGIWRFAKSPGFIQTATYADLLRAFEMMQFDELAVYHYRDFVARIFGIDVAQMTQNRMKSQSRPSDWSQEYLSDRNIDQEKLINRMKQQGAPIMV